MTFLCVTISHAKYYAKSHHPLKQDCRLTVYLMEKYESGQLWCLYIYILALPWTQKRTAGQRKAGMAVYTHIKTGVKILTKTFLQKKGGGYCCLNWRNVNFVICSQPIVTWCGTSCLEYLHGFGTLEQSLGEIWNGCQETKPWRGKI